MPIAKISIFGVTSSKEDDFFTSSSNCQLENLYVDKVGNDLVIRTRPGLSHKAPTPEANHDGCYGIYFPAANRMLFNTYKPTGTLTQILSTNFLEQVTAIGTVTGSALSCSNYILFNSGGVEYAVFGGLNNYIHYINPSLTVASLDTGVGNNVNQKLCELNNYILKLGRSDKEVYFCAVGDLTSWNALNFISTGNTLYNIHSFQDYLYVFEANRTFRYYNDGSTPFVSAKGQDIYAGTTSYMSVTDDGNNIYFIDSSARMGRIEGNSFVDLSQNVSKELKDIVGKSPAYYYCNFIEYYGKRFIVCGNSDSTTKTSMVYDIDLGIWSKWSFNDGNSTNGSPIFQTLYHPDANAYFGTYHGTGTAGAFMKLVEQGFDYAYDYNLSLGNLQIPQTFKTPFIDHGTHRNKRSRCIRLRCRKTTSAGTLRIAFRDNAEGSFVTMRDYDIDSDNDDLITIENFANGVYRQRQYKITSEGAIGKLGITDFEEEFEILGS